MHYNVPDCLPILDCNEQDVAYDYLQTVLTGGQHEIMLQQQCILEAGDSEAQSGNHININASEYITRQPYQPHTVRCSIV